MSVIDLTFTRLNPISMPIKVPSNYCIHCTLPDDYCVCDLAPSIILPTNCTILFHPRELSKRNSTGRLLKSCTDVKSDTWHRLKNEQMEAAFYDYALVYPALESDTNYKEAPIDAKGLLLIDSTWQESRKMIRQSPWLKKMRKYSIKSTPSTFCLRRNQTEGGLSTLESLAFWLKDQHKHEHAAQLLHYFHHFQQAFLKARQAGLLK